MQLIENEIFEFGSFLLDPIERTLSRQGTPVSLTPKAFHILLCLVRNQGRMVTKDELLRQIWPDTFVEEVNLAVNIAAIRKALGESPQESRFITTVPGRGYRFVAEVRTLSNQHGNWSGSAVGTLVAANSEDRGIVPKVENGSTALSDKPATAPIRRHLSSSAIPAVLALLITATLASYWWREKQSKVSAPGGSSINADNTDPHKVGPPPMLRLSARLLSLALGTRCVRVRH